MELSSDDLTSVWVYTVQQGTKQGKATVLRAVREPKKKPYAHAMLKEMLDRRALVSVTSRRDMSADDPRRVHPYVHPTPRPTAEQVADLRAQRHRRV